MMNARLWPCRSNRDDLGQYRLQLLQ
jgi:hypothetical protein